MIGSESILSKAKLFIKDFSISKENYKKYLDDKQIKITGYENEIYFKDKINAKIKIDFNKSKNVTVFLGRNIKGNLAINISGENSIIYIGNDCTLKNVIIKSEQSNDIIIIGNHVTTSGSVAWRSGLRSGNITSGIIIGDDCMFSHGITLRNTDAHPIFDFNTLEQINKPKDIILIEPHVWIGQNVLIMKNVTIGACSIVAAGAVVTKNMPRFSNIYGVPAIYRLSEGSFWARSYSSSAKNEALEFYMKFKKSLV